ncbi:hypothetical protein [Psychroserpens algicola]|uniref:YD repeat-containing protein n=1 Tax=Psychroserpens algicola TaxID=1719034 RepID=A0ABT0HAD8_9FLAO|nr:hypothetical protein [Psychroserpens algicola]MCK8481316.1 hypothetical protein [Psychroserpens algicola]
MKQLFFLLAFSFLIFSCENESTDSSDGNNPEVPELILKEMLVVNETTGAQEQSYFNTLGQMIKNDEYVNSSFISKDKLFYNLNNQRDSLHGRWGFEGETLKYSYENGLLTNILIDPISQAENINFNISYDGNEMIVTNDNLNNGLIRKYIFTDESHETLIAEELIYTPENSYNLPDVRYEYSYGPNSNLTERTKLVLNEDTQILEAISSTQYTYDTKKNPFKSLPGTNYLVSNNEFIGYYSTIFRLNHQSNNNVLSKTEITDVNPRQWIYEYEYNEFGYPINIKESYYFGTNEDGVLNLIDIHYKTLAYYDN